MMLQSGRQPPRSSKYRCLRNQRTGILKSPYGVGTLMVSCAGTTVRFWIFVGLPIHVRSLLEPTSQAVDEAEHVFLGLHSACVGTITRVGQNARKDTEEIVPCGR
jgi:hypothetical protein